MSRELLGDFIGKWATIIPKQNHMPLDDLYGGEMAFLCRIIKIDAEFLLIQIHDGRKILLSRDSIREVHPAKAPRYGRKKQFTNLRIVERDDFLNDTDG